jgi:predicted ribosome quality control (RQC) complex YloA/Tae2 family protein
MKFKVLKTWVSKDFTIIFQASTIAPKEHNLPKKIYVLLDLRQQSFGLRLTEEKPASATANHAFIQILRKHIPTFTFKDLLKDSAGNLFIPLLGGSAENAFWFIKLSPSKPPLASLVDPLKTVHVSFGQKGTFTKRHAAPGIVNWSEMTSVFHELEADLSAQTQFLSEDDEDQNEILATKEAISEEQRELAARLKRKLKTTRKNLDRLNAELPREVEVKKSRLMAQHLQHFAYLIKPDAHELAVEAVQSSNGEELRIPLEAELSAGQNIEAAFARARKLERKLQMGRQQIAQFENYERDLIADIERLRAAPEPASLWQQLTEKYKLPSLNSTPAGAIGPQVAKPYKTYLSSTGHIIHVGKGAKENDLLTKAARANDYWLHAVGVTGSHVIVPSTPELRRSLPAQLLKEAAILALSSSRLKEDQAGECYVTKRSNLKKQKNMPVGLWKVEQADTVFIRYTAEDLQKILANIKA